MSQATKGGATQELNTNYTRPTGVPCTIKRLSASANQFGSYTYALISGELPNGAKTYGKDGRVVFYVNKLVGAHLEDYKCNLTTVDRTNSTTGEVTKQLVIMRSESEVKAEEKFTREVQEISKEARAFGMSKQQVGNQYFAAKFGARFGVQSPVAELESAEA